MGDDQIDPVDPIVDEVGEEFDADGMPKKPILDADDEDDEEVM